MILGHNNFGSDLFAYADHVNAVRQIWTILCKPQSGWSEINKITPQIKECEDAT